MADPVTQASEGAASVDDIFGGQNPSLVSEKDGMDFIRQLAGETAGQETPAPTTNLPGAETLGPAESGGLTEEALLTALPEDMRGDATALLQGLRTPPQQQEQYGDLDDLVRLAQETPQTEETSPQQYDVEVPAELKPFLTDFTNEFSGQLKNAMSEIRTLKGELARSRQQAAANDVRVELRGIRQDMGDKVYEAVAPQAYKIMAAVPDLAKSEQGMRMAFELVGLRAQVNSLNSQREQAAQGGAVRRTTVPSGAPAETVTMGVEEPQTIQDAARIAAANILRSGEMTKAELTDLLG